MAASNPRKTYYDDLGVKRNATEKDIERAYRKYRSERELITAAPDQKRDNRMKAAYETLSNPDKRAMYDMALAEPERKKRSKGLLFATLGVLVLGGAAGAAYLLQPPPPPPPGSLSMDQLTHNASQAMARVDSLDLSGQKTPIGLAFSLEEGLVATACKGIGPMSQLSLYMAPRTVPVKVAQVDEKLGLCKLSAKGIGSWPLPVTSADPSPGEIVYVTKMNAVGEVSLVEAKVKRVVPTERGKVVEITVAVLPERVGGPVFNSRGHVIGVQILPEGSKNGEVVRIGPDWAIMPKAPEPVAAPPAPSPAETAPVVDDLKMQRKTRAQIEAEHKDQLEKALDSMK